MHYHTVNRIITLLNASAVLVRDADSVGKGDGVMEDALRVLLEKIEEVKQVARARRTE